jgi:hypothetical protein
MIPITKQKVGLGIQPKTSNHWNVTLPTNHNFIVLHTEAGVIPEIPMQLDTINTGGLRGTIPERDRVYLDMRSDLIKIPFTMLANRQNLRYILARAFQSVTMGVGQSYRKTFTIANSIGVLNVANNEGYLANIVAQSESNDGWQVINCVIDDLTISIEKDAQGINRLMKLSGNFVGSEIFFSKNFNTSQWVDSGLYNNLVGYLNNANEEFMIEGSLGDFDFEFTNRVWKKFELKINNRVSIPYRTTGGKAGNYSFNPEVRFNITLLYDSNTKNILEKIKYLYEGQGINSSSQLIVRNSYSTNQGGEIRIELNNIVIDSNPLQTEANLFMINLSGVCLNSDNTEPIIMYLSDGINNYG